MEQTQYSYYRWIIQTIIILLQIGLGLNFMAPSPLFLLIIDNYGISKGIVSILVSSVTLVMAISLIPGGFLISVIGSKKAMTLSGVLMSAGLLIPFVDSFTMIVVLRIFFGIGAAISIPTTSAITMEWFKPKEFPLINGVNESGRALGVSLGVLCAIPIANINGWETTLFLYSILPAIATLLWLIVGRSVINLTIPPPISSFKENIPLILNRNTILLAIGAIGPLSLFVGYSAWLPTYYNEVQGMTMVKAGSIVSIIPLVSAMLNPISGIILSKFDNRKFLLIISGLILPMFAFGAVFAVNQIILIMFIVGIGSLLSIAIVSIITIPMELPGVTAPKVGIVTAAILTIGNLSSVISPIFIGSYTEYIGSYIPALLIVALMPITLVISGLFLHISSPRHC